MTMKKFFRHKDNTPWDWFTKCGEIQADGLKGPTSVAEIAGFNAGFS